MGGGRREGGGGGGGTTLNCFCFLLKIGPLHIKRRQLSLSYLLPEGANSFLLK